MTIQDLGHSPAAALMARCRHQGPEPWLFFRRGWRWRWLSYQQAADQVARGLEVLRQDATSARFTGHVAVHGTQHPDMVTLFCMLMELEVTAAPKMSWADVGLPPLDPGDLWLHVADEPAGDVTVAPSLPPSPAPSVFTVPAAAGQLDRRALRPLTAEVLDAGVSPKVLDSSDRHHTLAELRRQAVRLAEVLSETHLSTPASGWWRRRRSALRPVVSVTPAMRPLDLWVVAWATLLMDGVCILEPQEDAFVPTVEWVRPTVVVVDGDDEEAAVHRSLVAAPKRHRRLRAVVSFEGADPGLDPQLWQELGVQRLQMPSASPFYS